MTPGVPATFDEQQVTTAPSRRAKAATTARTRWTEDLVRKRLMTAMQAITAELAERDAKAAKLEREVESLKKEVGRLREDLGVERRLAALEARRRGRALEARQISGRERQADVVAFERR